MTMHWTLPPSQARPWGDQAGQQRQKLQEDHDHSDLDCSESESFEEAFHSAYSSQSESLNLYNLRLLVGLKCAISFLGRNSRFVELVFLQGLVQCPVRDHVRDMARFPHPVRLHHSTFWHEVALHPENSSWCPKSQGTRSLPSAQSYQRKNSMIPRLHNGHLAQHGLIKNPWNLNSSSSTSVWAQGPARYFWKYCHARTWNKVAIDFWPLFHEFISMFFPLLQTFRQLLGEILREALYFPSPCWILWRLRMSCRFRLESSRNINSSLRQLMKFFSSPFIIRKILGLIESPALLAINSHLRLRLSMHMDRDSGIYEQHSPRKLRNRNPYRIISQTFLSHINHLTEISLLTPPPMQDHTPFAPLPPYGVSCS